MTQLEIYQKAAKQFNLANPNKVTIIGETEMGGHYCLHVHAISAEIKPYAQYKESLVLYFRKKGARSVSGMRFYGTRPFALFSGWQTSSFEMPNSYMCFDKSLFYGIVDGIDANCKICEESERVHLAEIQQREKIYAVYHLEHTENGSRRCVAEDFESAEQLKESYESAGEFHSVSCRAELQGAPKLKNFCGPMYDGEDDQGCAVIRYESREVYEILSA